MDRIVKATAFDGQVRITIIDTTDAVQESIKIHDLTPLAADLLGRALSVGSYISTNIKYENSRVNIIISGDGSAGRVCVAGMARGKIKGFVENSHVTVDCAGSADVAVKKAIGQKGEIIVVKDLGLKSPYVGRCDLVSGNIAEDFAHYLHTSEGIKSDVALGVVCDKSGCVFSYGLFVEALPGATAESLFIADDIVRKFTTDSVLCNYNIEQILNFHFGHLKLNVLGIEQISLYCDCDKKIYNVIKSLGKEEAESMLQEKGNIEIKCDYCAKKYIFTKEHVDEMFKEN